MSKKLAVLFPGQGSHFIGMGKKLCETYDCALRVYQEANDYLNYDLRKICFEGGISKLNKMDNMLLAIFCTNVAMYKVYKEKAFVEPEFMLGHSLGEYSALVCSEAISFTDALKLIKLRCQYAEDVYKTGKYSVLVVEQLAIEKIESLCTSISGKDKKVEIAAYNTSMQALVGGDNECVEELEKELTLLAATTTPLLTSAPFHTNAMSEYVAPFYEAIDQIEINMPKYRIISNVSGKEYTDSLSIKMGLAKQLALPVLWRQSMQYVARFDIDGFVEIGPKSVLTGFAREDFPHKESFALGQNEDKARFEHYVKEGENNYSKFIAWSLGVVVSLENRNWDDAEYQAGVVEPYERVEKILTDAEENGRYLNKEDMIESCRMLQSVADTKKVSNEIFETKVKRLFEKTGIDIEEYTYLFHFSE